MGKLIVMHHHPDLDAIGAGWLLVRFLKSEFRKVSFAFVPAGSTYRNQVVDIDPDVIHVDTGGGRFDHHDRQRNDLSATVLVYKYLISRQSHLAADEALALLVDFINEIDHFGEYAWPDPLHPRYAFVLSNIIPALHALNRFANEEVVELVFIYLDAVYQYLKNWLAAKEIIKKGRKFVSQLGKGVAIESGADEAMKIAQMMGYDVVVRKDPRKGYMKIKLAPKGKQSLGRLYDRILKIEGEDRWYFHPSGRMLINGSSKKPDVKPSQLTVDQVIQMITNIY